MMLSKTALIKAFRSGAYAQVFTDVGRYGSTFDRKDISVNRLSAGILNLSFIKATHHGLQFIFELCNGEVKVVTMSTKTNLF